MRTFRFIFLVSILIIGFNLYVVVDEVCFENESKILLQNDFEYAHSFSATPNDDSFGITTKIPGVEGAFAVVVTDDIGGVYVAYQSHWEETNNQSQSFHVYFAYSHDFGENWSKSYRVDDNASSSVFCDSPSIAIDRNNGHIFVAWKDNRTGVAKVYIDKSVDRGVSFGSDVTINDSLNDYFPPWLPYTVNLEICEEGKIFVTWVAYSSENITDGNIFFTYSDDGGQTFKLPIIISSMESEAILTHPWVVIDSNNVIYVVYTKRSSTTTKSSAVYLVKSQNGSSFETPVTVTDFSTQKYVGGAQVAVSSDGKIHVVWTDNRAGDGPEYLDIYFATSLDGGLTISPNIYINDDNEMTPREPGSYFTRGIQGTPTICVDSNDEIHLFWEDFRNYISDSTYSRDIYYTSSENGTVFSDNLKVNYIHPDVDSVNAADPYITLDSQDNFYLVYSDAPSGDNNYHYIYFMFIQQLPETSTSTDIISSQQSSETSTSTDVISSQQSSETSTSTDIIVSTFGFQLIPIITVFLVTIFIRRKKIEFKK
ncbi:MAG: sialidase family protein [Candidatus Hodarchaeales archaeon]|jgi:hypothetical protein